MQGTKSSLPGMRLWLDHRPGVSYALTLAILTLVFLLRSWLAPTLGNQALLLFLVPPVLLAGVVGGWGPGLMATAYAMALQLFVTGDFGSLIDVHAPLFAAAVARSITFAVIGGTMAWFGGYLQRASADTARSAQATAAREAHLESILDTIPDAMVVIDQRGCIQSFSAAAERLFGHAASELMGRNI